MPDIATLGLRVDGRDAVRDAAASMRELEDATRGAEGAARDLETTERESARSVEDIAQRQAETRRRIIEQNEKFDEQARQRRRAIEEREAHERVVRGEESARAVLEAEEAQFQLAVARIKDAQARGFLTPAEAEIAGQEAAQAYNAAIIKTIDQTPEFRPASGSSGAFTALAGSLKNIDDAGRQASVGTGRLRQSLVSLLRQTTDTHPAVAQLTNALGGFALGSGLMIGVLGGLAAISTAWRLLTREAREAKEELDESTQVLSRLQQQQAEGITRGIPERIQSQLASIRELEQEALEIQQRLAQPSIGPGQDRRVDTAARDRLAAIRREINERNALIAAGQIEVVDILAEAQERQNRIREAAQREAEQAAAAERRILEERERAIAEFRRFIDSNKQLVTFFGGEPTDLSALFAAGLGDANDFLTLTRVATDLRDIAEDTTRSYEDRAAALEQMRRILEDMRTGTLAGVELAPLNGLNVPLDRLPNPTNEGINQVGDSFFDSLAKAAPDFERGGRALLQSADALLDIDARVRGVADGLLSAVGALGQRDKDDGLSGLGFIGLAGAGLGIIDSLFGDRGPSAQEQARIRAQEANTQALERLRDQLDKIDLNFAQASGLAGVVGRQAESPLFDSRTYGGIVQDLEDLGLTFADVTRISRELGITLVDEFGTVVPGALRDFADALEAEAERIRRLDAEFTEGLIDRRLGLQSQLPGGEAAAEELRQRQRDRELSGLDDRFGLDSEQAQVLRDIFQLEDELAELREQEAAEAIERQIASMRDEIAVRRLIAAGNDEGADQLRREIAQRKELEEARELGDEALLAEIEALHEAEDAAYAAAQAERELAEERRRVRDQRSFAADLAERRADLGGDSLGALRIRLQEQADAELDRARDLFEAGTITAEQFAELADILELEMAAAIREFIDLQREAAEAEEARVQAITRNLTLRILEANGQDEDAIRLRQMIELEEARRNGWTEDQILLLQQAQAAEDAARARQDELDALQETERAINGVTRALNAPAGLNLALLGFRAGFAGTGVQPGGTTVQITINQQPGQDGAELAQIVAREFTRFGRSGSSLVVREA